MKRMVILATAFIGICSMAMTSCEEQLPQEIQAQLDEKKEQVTDKITAQMKAALIEQLEDFLESDDLEESLGFSKEQLEETEQVIKQYIEEYDFDEAALTELVDEIQTLFNDTGLSKEEIQTKLNQLLEQ